MSLVIVPLIFGSALVTLLHGVQPPPVAPGAALPYVFVRTEPAPVLLRGDWESPAAIAVAYQLTWSDTLLGVLDAAAPHTPSLLLLKSDSSPTAAGIWLEAHGFGADEVVPLETAIDTAWIRDGGPLQRVERDTGNVRWLDMRYPTRPKDDLLPRVLGTYMGIPVEQLDLDLDGGAIISNGRGQCVTTEESMLETGADIEDPAERDKLLGILGCDFLVEVPALSDDPTRHVDMLAQFVAEDAIMVASFDSTLAPEDASRMDEAVERLQDAARLTGRPLRIFRIPLLPATEGVYYSWINGLRLRDAFVAPVFTTVAQEAQQAALLAIRAAMPDVTIIPVVADDPISLSGGIHCIAFGIYEPRPKARRLVSPQPRRGLSRVLAQ